MDKCFCHLNGYAVKDATARTEIEVLRDRLQIITGTLTQPANSTEGECYIQLPNGLSYENCVVVSAYYIASSSGYKIFEKGIGCLRPNDNHGLLRVIGLPTASAETTYECGLVLMKI